MHTTSERESLGSKRSSSWRASNAWVSPWGFDEEFWDAHSPKGTVPEAVVPSSEVSKKVPPPPPPKPLSFKAEEVTRAPEVVAPPEPAIALAAYQTERTLIHHAPSTDRSARNSVGTTPVTSKSPVTLPKQAELPFKDQPRSPTARPERVAQSHPSWPSFVLLFIGLASFVFLALVYLKDSDPLPDDDLRIQQPRDITAKTQAPERLKLFLDSVPRIKNPNLKNKAPWDWDTPTLSQTVQASAAALDNLRDILEDSDWHPRHSDWNQSDLGAHEAWPDAALLLQVRAAYLARRGEEESALIAAFDLARLSQHLQQILAWPSFTKRSLEMQERCCQSVAELLKGSHLSSSQLAIFQEKFNTLAPSLETVLDAFNGFYIFEKKVLLGPASGEAIDTLPEGINRPRPGRLFFKTQETLQRFATGIRALKEELTAAPNNDLFSIQSGRIMQTAPQVYQPNATGERYFSDRVDQYLEMPNEFKLAEARRGLVECLFAIRRFMVDQKRFPSGLGALHPAYLASLPTDPFSGEIYLYDATRARVSSLGINRVADDQQQSRNPSLSDQREPTVELVTQAAPVK